MSMISTAIELQDRVSASLNRIQTSLYSVTTAFDAVDSASNRCFDQLQVEAVSREMLAYEQQINKVEHELMQANAQIERMKNETEQAKIAASGLGGSFGSILNIFGAYAGFQGFQQLIALSDSMGQAEAKLGLITDDLQEQEEMQERIFQAAQRSRGSYMAMADNVAKLGQRAGDAFSSNDEILQFSENLTKMFVIAGASQAEMSSASLQLTQALGSGVLRGEELNAVFESAPNVIQAIAKYMDVPIGKIREMASEGELTSEIVKNAMLSATEEINAQFESMPLTWAQIWTITTNEILRLSQPILNFITMVAQHWDTLKPIFIGAAIALGVYTAALLIHKTMAIASAMAESRRAAAAMLATGATFAETAAQIGFNAALAACPITWIIVGIIALVTVIYMIAQAVANTTDNVESGFGIIMGVVFTAGAFIFNTVVGLLNGIIQLLYTLFLYPAIGVIEFFLNVMDGGFNSFGDACANLIGTIIGWFLNLGMVVTKIIDAIFGTDWTAGLNDLKEDVQAWGKNEEAITLDKNFTAIQGIEYGKAWDAGTSWGDDFNVKVDKMLGKSDATNNAEQLNQIAAYTGDTAANTAKTANSVEITGEQLQYMRDLAEREVINRYTTAEIKVDMTNNNNISKDVDVEDIISILADGVNEAMKVSAEGVA